MKKITEYFRNTLTAQMNTKIDIKNDSHTIQQSVIEYGEIDDETTLKLFNEFHKKQDDSMRNNQESKQEVVSVIIALKTIATKVVDSKNEINDVDELTVIFYLPAILNKNGRLSDPGELKVPWIPREYMAPMIEAELDIGNSDNYDAFLSENIDGKNQIDSWEKYFEYAKHMYEYVTKTPFNQTVLNNQNQSKLDGKMYIFLDNTVNASFHVLNLYNCLLGEIPQLPLYEKLLNTKAEMLKPLILNSSLLKMKQHCGQMGGEYPLSESQREALNHFNELKMGDILAVNGPPGTGKTTLLQSVVANLFTQHALREDKPPIIVAASTNNQAVTNIIDSFGKINETGIKNLETRWIKSVNSFATYFPSKGKVKEAKDKR